MLCSKCGNMLNENDKFCGKCGNQVDSIEQMQLSQEQTTIEDKTFIFKRSVLFGNNPYSRKNKISTIILKKDEIFPTKLFMKSIPYSSITSIQVKDTIDTGNIIFLIILWCIFISFIFNDNISEIIFTGLCVLIFTIRGFFFLKVRNIIITNNLRKRYKIVSMSTKENPTELINTILIRAGTHKNNISVLGDFTIKNLDKKDNVAEKIVNILQDISDN